MRITYIAFLRAINVGGHTVTMERLRGLFSELGLENVRTYIQTGNVFFETSESDRKSLTEKIEAHLATALGYEVPTLLRTIQEVEYALQLDPFKDVELTADTRFCILFLSQSLLKITFPHRSPKGDFEILSATSGEAFVVIHLIKGVHGNISAYIEKTFGAKATARFFATTLKILAAAKSA